MDGDDNKHPTQKLIGMDVREKDKQMAKAIGREEDEGGRAMGG